MAAHADDLRYWYSETIGDTIEVNVGAVTIRAGGDEPLAPGRYLLRVLDFGTHTDLWIRQGQAGDVEATASPPSMRFVAHTDAARLNLPLLTFIVRPGSRGGNPEDGDGINGLALIGVGGANAIVQLTKYSRDVH